MAFTPQDDNRKFSELYNVQRLKSSYVASDSQVCISTIQRLYSILKGQELEDWAEEENPNERLQPKEPMPVVYNPKIPPEFFDFVVIDECHRSIYNLWQQVLDYFDAFLIGLTATPDKRTFGFFNENVVSEYSHEDAVMDGVNVGYEVYTIETEITKKGSRIAAKEYVDRRDKLTRAKRWQQLDEEVTYRGKQLDRDVVNPSQIRHVIRTFREKLPDIFPHRPDVPKTLIFAKDDSHADDIIQMVRQEFGEGNAFCKKVTYKATEDPKSILNQFRNDYYPRIAVTVDMIATGTDVKPLECLIFMRDVKSRNYFEQMKGRGTRTLDKDGLNKVTKSNNAKTHFVIIDAVGVTKSVKTDSRPLERKRSVPLKDLLTGVMMGGGDTDSLTSLAGRLARLERQMTEAEKAKLYEIGRGKTVGEMAKAMLHACDPDVIAGRARQFPPLARGGKGGLTPYEMPTAGQWEAAQEALRNEAADCLTGEVIEYLDNVRKVHEQIIDRVNLDKVTFAGWDTEAKDKARELVQDFAAFIEANKDEIVALRIFYNQPQQHRTVTTKMVREVLEILQRDKPHLAPLRVWQAYEQVEEVEGKSPLNEMTALVALIRRVVGLDEKLTTFESTVNRRFQDWVFKKQAGKVKFNEAQMAWLRMMKEHIICSFQIERDDLDYAPFDAQGGVGKMYQLFGDEMDAILTELNEAVA